MLNVSIIEHDIQTMLQWLLPSLQPLKLLKLGNPGSLQVLGFAGTTIHEFVFSQRRRSALPSVGKRSALPSVGKTEPAMT